MASSVQLKTHKIKRNQAKKRKLEAFLELVRQDESRPLQRKPKAKSTFQQNYKALKDELKKYQKKQTTDPVFCLKDDGSCAIVNFTPNDETSKCNLPLFVEDIYHLLLRSVLGNVSPFPLNWAKFEGAPNACKTVLLEIVDSTLSDVIELQSKFNQNNTVFPYIIEVMSSDIPFASELSTLHLAANIPNQSKENYSSIFPTEKLSNANNSDSNSTNNISKLHLLLSPIQLAMEHYPLPISVFEQSKTEGYCFSKETYDPVHENSPMFAVDCEMCRIVSGKQDVTRIAIVNEDLETVYHTLVKPKEEIVDYITRFSGITEKMLRNVSTTLEDVQNDMRKLLPSDAILCGQSLNCDLHALKMIHPYVIDTSVIYNENGMRQRKTSLKQLARKHLSENIQDGKKGHNPIEDSIATMKLVQLKLKKFLGYGDAVLFESSEDNENTNGKDNTSSIIHKELTFSGQNPHLNESGIFSILSRFSKKVYLIGTESALSNYCQETIIDNVSLESKSGVKEITKMCIESIENYDLALSHLTLHSENYSPEELNDQVKELFSSLPSKTLFIIYMSGNNNLSKGKLRKNYCMITVKTDKAM